MAIVGIDVPENKIDVGLLLDHNKVKYKIFENTQKDFEALVCWLKELKVIAAHVCLEATGRYLEAIAFVHAQNKDTSVSIVNTKPRIKAYAHKLKDAWLKQIKWILALLRVF